jgi:hypothetical protein
MISAWIFPSSGRGFGRWLYPRHRRTFPQPRPVIHRRLWGHAPRSNMGFVPKDQGRSAEYDIARHAGALPFLLVSAVLLPLAFDLAVAVPKLLLPLAASAPVAALILRWVRGDGRHCDRRQSHPKHRMQSHPRLHSVHRPAHRPLRCARALPSAAKSAGPASAVARPPPLNRTTSDKSQPSASQRKRSGPVGTQAISRPAM